MAQNKPPSTSASLGPDVLKVVQEVRIILDSVIKTGSPEMESVVAKNIQDEIEKLKTQSGVVEVVSGIISTGYTMPSSEFGYLSRLLLAIKDSKIVQGAATKKKLFTVAEAIPFALLRLINHYNDPSGTTPFRKKLAFVNELYRVGFIRPLFFGSCVRLLLKKGDNNITVNLMYEIVRNIDEQVVAESLTLTSSEAAYFDACAHFLYRTVSSNKKAFSDRTVDEMFAFLESLTKVGGFGRHQSADYLREVATLEQFVPREIKKVMTAFDQHPELRDHLTRQAEDILRCALDTSIFIAGSDIIMKQASLASDRDQASYWKLLRDLKPASLFDISPSSKAYEFCQAVVAVAMRMRSTIAHSSLEDFRKLLRLVEKLCEEGILGAWVFRYYATHLLDYHYTKKNATIKLYEVMRLADVSTKGEIWTGNHVSLWQKCCATLAAFCEKEKDNPMPSHILSYLKLHSNNLPPLESVAAKRKSSGTTKTGKRPSSSSSLAGSSAVPSLSVEVSEENGDLIQSEPSSSDTRASFLADIIESYIRNPKGLKLCASQIYEVLIVLTAKSQLKGPIHGMLTKMVSFGRSNFPAFSDLLGEVLKLADDHGASLRVVMRKVLLSWAQQIPNVRGANMYDIAEYHPKLIFINELFKSGLVPFTFYSFLVHTNVAGTADKRSAEFLFMVLLNFHEMMEAGILSGNNSSAMAFCEKITQRLVEAHSKKLFTPAMGVEVNTFLDHLRQVGGWHRTSSDGHCTSNAEIETPVANASDNSNLPVVALGIAQTTSLSWSELGERFTVINESSNSSTFEALKQKVQVEPNTIPSEFVNTVLHKVLMELPEKPFIEAVAELLVNVIDICSVGSESRFVRLFEKAATNMLLTSLVCDVSTLRRCFVDCPRVVGVLFAKQRLTFPFLVDYLNLLLSIKIALVYEGFLFMLSESTFGTLLNLHATVNGKAAWYESLFLDLSHQCQDTSTSGKLQTIADEILVAKTKGWPVLNYQQRLIQKLRLLMLDLTPELTRTPREFSAATARIRNFIDTCPEEHYRPLFDIFLNKIENCMFYLADSDELEPCMSHDSGRLSSVNNFTIDSLQNSSNSDIATPTESFLPLTTSIQPEPADVYSDLPFMEQFAPVITSETTRGRTMGLGTKRKGHSTAGSSNPKLRNN